MGGGLAGLTLALQLRQRFADIDVLVLERRPHPVPEACHKVGESTVEIGAHYFEHVLGLQRAPGDRAAARSSASASSSPKAGATSTAVTELGASRPLAVSSWQIDRGIFENFLGDEAQRRGVRFVDDAMVREVDLSDSRPAPHQVTLAARRRSRRRPAARAG